MENNIIATTLSGLFVNSNPWKKAHKKWFEEAAIDLQDDSIKQLAEKKDYWEYVDGIMKKLCPEISNERELTILARLRFFNMVYKSIEENSQIRNKDIIPYFGTLKTTYRIALITTNPLNYIGKILELTKIKDLFDIVGFSRIDEKDDREVVFDRFRKQYGNPLVYIGSDHRDSFDYCNKHGIPCIFANLESKEDLEKVTTIHSPPELVEKLERIIKNRGADGI